MEDTKDTKDSFFAQYMDSITSNPFIWWFLGDSYHPRYIVTQTSSNIDNTDNTDTNNIMVLKFIDSEILLCTYYTNITMCMIEYRGVVYSGNTNLNIKGSPLYAIQL